MLPFTGLAPGLRDACLSFEAAVGFLAIKTIDVQTRFKKDRGRNFVRKVGGAGPLPSEEN